MEAQRLRRLRSFGCLGVVLCMVFLAACSGGVDAEYTCSGGLWTSLKLQSGGKAYASAAFLGQTVDKAGTYSVDGDKINVVIDGQSTVFTRAGKHWMEPWPVSAQPSNARQASLTNDAGVVLAGAASTFRENVGCMVSRPTKGHSIVCDREAVLGLPDPEHVSTNKWKSRAFAAGCQQRRPPSHRAPEFDHMAMRRFTHLSKCFLKEDREPLSSRRAQMMYDNFARKHAALGATA